jgi:hypothetical protein
MEQAVCRIADSTGKLNHECRATGSRMGVLHPAPQGWTMKGGFVRAMKGR